MSPPKFCKTLLDFGSFCKLSRWVHEEIPVQLAAQLAAQLEHEQQAGV
jgi:hypothetical protein